MTSSLVLARVDPQIPPVTHQNKNPTVARSAEIVPRIRDVAKRALIELCVMCAFAGVTAAFMSTTGITTLFITVAITIVFNTTIRCFPVYFYSELEKLRKTEERDPATVNRIAVLEKRLENSLTFVGIVCPMSFGILDMNTRNLVTHEAGHALAVLALYKDGNPTVGIYAPPDKWDFWSYSGDTTWNSKKLTEFGSLIGRDGSKIMALAAGTGFSLLFAYLSLIGSRKCKENHPELSRYMLASAITSIAQSVLYALSAFWASSSNHFHDFVQLWAKGVNPIVSLIAILLPIIIRGGMYAYEYVKNRISENNQQRQLALT